MKAVSTRAAHGSAAKVALRTGGCGGEHGHARFGCMACHGPPLTLPLSVRRRAGGGGGGNTPKTGGMLPLRCSQHRKGYAKNLPVQ